MNYTGKWLISGSWDFEKIQNFEKMFKKELPNLDYEELVKNDCELQQTLEISSDGKAYFDTKNEKLSGTLETEEGKDILNIDGEKIPLKLTDGFLVFDIPGGYVFKRV